MFPPQNKQLEPLGILGILRHPLGQRRYLHRMVHDEGGLNQLFLHIGFKEKVEDIPPLVALLIFDMVRLGQGTGLFRGLHPGKIHPGVLFDGVGHAQPLEGLFQIDLHAVVIHLGGPQHPQRHRPDQILRQIHHAVVVGVGLIQLQQGELRVVAGIHPLVAEHPADFIYPLKAAHDQPLQVQLQRNAQVHVHIQGVVVGDEGAGRRAAGNAVEHGGFHLQKSLFIQITADLQRYP